MAAFDKMIPIYGEAANLVENAFDRLEREAIKQFRGGIPVLGSPSKRVMKCCNEPDGALPKTWLYILVGEWQEPDWPRPKWEE